MHPPPLSSVPALTTRHRPGRPEPTTESWARTLALANLWELARARADSIAELDARVPAPAARVALARQLDIPGWQVPALDALVRRRAPLGAEDVAQLGVGTVLRVGALRETYGAAVTEAAQAHHEARVREARALRRELKLMRAAYDGETLALADRIVGAPPTLEAKRKRAEREFVQPAERMAATIDTMLKQAADALAKIPKLTPEIIRETFELDEDA
jgi:hypothetical protein